MTGETRFVLLLLVGIAALIGAMVALHESSAGREKLYQYPPPSHQQHHRREPQRSAPRVISRGWSRFDPRRSIAPLAPSQSILPKNVNTIVDFPPGTTDVT